MIKTLIATSVAVLVTGCATSAIEKMNPKVEAKRDEASSAIASMRRPEPSSVTFSDTSFIPLKRMEKAQYTPEQRKVLSTEIESYRNFNNLNEIASWLTSITNAPVFINPELATQTTGSATPAPVTLNPATFPGVFPGQATSAAATSISGRPFAVTYSGSVSGFLDVMAANYGIFWKMEGQNVRLLMTDSRTYRIKALPGDTQFNSMVGATSSSAGTGGASTSAASSTAAGTANNSTGVAFTGLSVWNGIETGIKQLLTPTSGKVAVSPSTGTVTVTDTPRILDIVTEYIREQNISLSRQVAVNVRVLSVEINDADNYGINWSAVYNNLADNAAFSLKTAFPTAIGAASIVLNTSTPSANNWSAASGAIISALSTQGKVSELTSATLVTLNNQPAPVNVGRQVSYLASSSTTQAANAGTTTALTPGQVQTGFSMVLMPHIIDGKELLIQSSINMSSLVNLSTITSGGSSIQSPDLSTSNFIQRVRLSSGDTLVMAGYDQDNLSAVAKGLGLAQNPLMGSKDVGGKRSMLVILIQPTVAI